MSLKDFVCGIIVARYKSILGEYVDKKSEMIKKDPLWGRDFILVILSAFLIYMGFQMLLPTLPVYAITLGGSKASAGLIVGIITFSSIFIRPFTGHALDIYGRKGIFIVGLLLFIISVLAYIWAPTVLFLLAIRFVQGFGWGISSTAASTVAADVVPRSRMGEGMGYYGLAGTLSMALAPAVGLFIINKFNFKIMFLISALFVIAALIMALFVNFNRAVLTPKKLSLIEKAAIRPTLVIFFMTMTYGGVVSFIVLFAAQRGIDNVGSFFTAYALSLIVFRPLAGRMTDKVGFDLVVIPGIVLVGVAMILLYYTSSIQWLLISAVVYGAGFGAVQPSLQALAIVRSAPDRRGSANATFFTGFDLGIGLSSIIWGIVAEKTDYSMIYALSVIPVIAALLSYLLFGRSRKVKLY